MDTREFTFADESKVLLVSDTPPGKKTLVFTKTVDGKEINFAVDFPTAENLYDFNNWLDDSATGITGI